VTPRMGTGVLAVIGGTVVIVAFLTVSSGALVAVQGYNQIANVSVEAPSPTSHQPDLPESLEG
jgi:ABC-type transporter Mla maintaining outer membrane lipid asymmetry permease subunit MlaE